MRKPKLVKRHEPNHPLSRNPDSRVRYLSSFDSMAEVMEYFRQWGVTIDRKQIEMAYRALEYRKAYPEQFSRHILDYKLVVTGGEFQRRNFQIYRVNFDREMPATETEPEG